MATKRKLTSPPPSPIEDEEEEEEKPTKRRKQDERDYIPKISGTLRQAVLIHMREQQINTFSAALLDLVRRGLEATSHSRLNIIGFYAQLEGVTFRQMWLLRARGDYEPPDLEKLTDEQFKALYELLGRDPNDQPTYGDNRLF